MPVLLTAAAAQETPPTVPHLAIPFVVGPDGSAETVQQDSLAEVTQSVAYLLGTRPGTRFMEPRYGLTDPTFAGLNAHEVQLAVQRWEPRATVTVAALGGSEEQATVRVALASGGSTP